MNVKTKIVKKVFNNQDFYIFGCIPIGTYPNLILHPQYHNFTLKGNLGYLTEGKIYDLNISEQQDKNGIYYKVNDCPTLTNMDFSKLSYDESYQIMCEITTEKQAKELLSKYPSFIQLVMENRTDEVDVKKLYDIKEKRLSAYIRDVKNKYRYYHLMMSCKEFNLSIEECRKLDNKYENLDAIKIALNCEPYRILIDVCDRGFESVDVLCKKVVPNLMTSKQRKQYAVQWILKMNEYDGNTKILANTMVAYLSDYDKRLVDGIVDIVKNCPLFHYDESTKYLGLISTWLAECNIANFIKDKIKNNKVLDWDYTKFTEIKDGVLTDEQSNVLKMLCENRFCVLDAPSGTGKSSTLHAVLDMLDYYNINYICMTATGKSSQRLSEQTNRPSSTIHRRVLSGDIYEDIIIIDEYSLLSVELFSMVINAIKNPNIRMFLVGDSCQLPSLNCGRIAKDLLETDIVPKCTLTHCFRFDEGGASYVSELTRLGKFYFTNEQCKKTTVTLGTNQDYTFIQSDNTVSQIIDIYMKIYAKTGCNAEDICLLTPLNIREFGAINLNNLIQKQINPPKKNQEEIKIRKNNTDIFIRKNDLVMNTKNNYQVYNKENYKLNLDEEKADFSSIFNGMIGRVLEIKDKIAYVQFGDEIIVMDDSLNKHLLLAYVTNPYKYQGSQCKHIINLILPQHERQLNKQLDYTSKTRQQLTLTEIGDIDTMRKTVSKVGDDNRLTYLKELLKP